MPPATSCSGDGFPFADTDFSKARGTPVHLSKGAQRAEQLLQCGTIALLVLGLWLSPVLSQ